MRRNIIKAFEFGGTTEYRSSKVRTNRLPGFKSESVMGFEMVEKRETKRSRNEVGIRVFFFLQVVCIVQ